ncbi:hypothetical protein NFI96_014266, partial [Prochilodus magdalenae]
MLVVGVLLIVWGGQEKKSVMIKENGVRVPVTLLNEAANEEFERDRDIVITHVKVDKTWPCGKKLTTSNYTVIFKNTNEEKRRFVEDIRLVFLAENQEELGVPRTLWPRDSNQLPQQLPVD